MECKIKTKTPRHNSDAAVGISLSLISLYIHNKKNPNPFGK